MRSTIRLSKERGYVIDVSNDSECVRSFDECHYEQNQLAVNNAKTRAEMEEKGVASRSFGRTSRRDLREMQIEAQLRKNVKARFARDQNRRQP